METRNFKKTAGCEHNKYPHNVSKEVPAYGFYSKILNKPFDTVAELTKAEEAYFAALKAKEDKAAAKKADAKKVEDAFKAMNAARKDYKEKLTACTVAYAENLQKLKSAFEEDKKAIQASLAESEAAYAEALKTFTNQYPEGYHITLRDGDFETTIDSKTAVRDSNPKAVKAVNDLFDFFDLFCRF